jgi:hypothetical protein
MEVSGPSIASWDGPQKELSRDGRPRIAGFLRVMWVDAFRQNLKRRGGSPETVPKVARSFRPLFDAARTASCYSIILSTFSSSEISKATPHMRTASQNTYCKTIAESPMPIAR